MENLFFNKKILVLKKKKKSFYYDLFIKGIIQYGKPKKVFFVEYDSTSSIFETNRKIKNLIFNENINIFIVTSFYFINPDLLYSIQGKVFRIKIDGDDVALFNVYSKYYSKFYDLNITNTFEICKKFKKLGTNSFTYASPVFDNFTKKKKLNHKQNLIDVSFIGLIKNKRKHQVDFLKKKKINIKVFGDNKKTKFLSQNDYFETFKKSKINLNFCSLTHDPKEIFIDEKKFNKLKNMSGRIFEVLSCKSFLLTEYNPSLEYFFKPGKDLEVFKNNDELFDKIKFYLSNKRARDKISLHGFNTFMKKYEYQTYMPHFINSISSFKGKELNGKKQKCPKLVKKFLTQKYISKNSLIDLDFYLLFIKYFDITYIVKKFFKKIIKI